MDAIGLVQLGFEQSHGALRETMDELDQESAFWQPGAGLNHPGFLLWHVVRDEDELLARLGGEPQLWDEWAGRLGIEERGQGTGFNPERIASFWFPFDAFREYAEAVWARNPGVIGGIEASQLDEVTPSLSDWTLGQLLLEGYIGHNWVHLGEVRAILGLRGWRFRE